MHHEKESDRKGRNPFLPWVAGSPLSPNYDARLMDAWATVTVCRYPHKLTARSPIDCGNQNKSVHENPLLSQSLGCWRPLCYVLAMRHDAFSEAFAWQCKAQGRKGLKFIEQSGF